MKKKCSSSRGPSQDLEEEEKEQDLGQMLISSPSKDAEKSNEYLLYSEYFKNIAIVPEETINNNLTQNGITYDSTKGK